MSHPTGKVPTIGRVEGLISTETNRVTDDDTRPQLLREGPRTANIMMKVKERNLNSTQNMTTVT